MTPNFSITDKDFLLIKAWPQHQNLVLNIGEWSNSLTELEVKTCIAVALNHCTLHKNLTIIGYLINLKKVFLILAGNQNKVEQDLSSFYDQLKLELKAIRQRKKLKEENLEELFEMAPFINPFLIKLITGQNVDLPYHNGEVKKLKAEVDEYDFCSAIDYSGAKGPVVVESNWKTKRTK